ncbi:hypothetical protein [Ahrensia sp. R2A130]|uniref:hypothetical protein n=1 Tax=Ahrensia sp. R2A130 TaxID=744979 RepID=UPI0001E0E83F|nr:hypothetical protein [Ahrensia sp. R2A130]EFL90923.1 putative transmembrane anchor protein [Ahrensia sp. R2A130]
MHNAPKPKIEDLPTLPQLRRSAIVATLGAVAIGIMVYLPAEYGTDPTGVGSVLGLTEMGEIKQQLANEAAEDSLTHDGDRSSSLTDTLFELFVSTANAQKVWKDEITFTLAPGEATEIKAKMEKGATLFYSWTSTGGRVNFDLHAHASGEKVTYEKGRGRTEGEGSFETPFTGNHGWFWRNRDKVDVTVTLKMRGDYSEIVKTE